MSKENILVLNCGSSSLKFAVINPATEEELMTGLSERLGQNDEKANLVWKINGEKTRKELPGADHDLAIKTLLDGLKENNLIDTLKAVGHRVVHGGEQFTESCLIDDAVIAGIEACIPLAPLHNPAHLAGIRLIQKYLPELPNTAVFDTSFHQSMPAKAYLYALPYELYTEKHVRRYGFHGTSHRYVSARAAEMIGKPVEDAQVLVAHLGNGCSATAVVNGKSMDTTMGLTPLEGLVMGTRSGNVDPNLFNFLHHEHGMSLDEITDMLNKKSGLLGISGLSNDCRTVEDAYLEGNERAALALDVFCYVLAKQLAGLAMSMDRIDVLAFTGGIGENGPILRAKVLNQLGVLGFKLDEEANEAAFRGKEGSITQEGSTPSLVVCTNEELVIARDTAALVA